MKSGLLLIFSGFTITASAQCSSTGPNNGNSFSNDASVGTLAWSSTNYAQLSDNNRAPANVSLGILSSVTTNYLSATDFGFSIPSGASICGIQVDVEKKYNLILGLLTSITDHSVRIVKGGTISGSDHASGSGWASTDAYSSYGGSSDLWGLTWTAADINAPGFGAVISATVSSGLAALTLDALINHIRITVFFNVTLPVTFEDFWAVPERDRMKLLWSTASEFNSNRFVLEKMIQGNAVWKTVDSVPAAFNSVTERHYETYDPAPDETNIYRIRQVDIDGRSLYSKTLSVRFHSSGNLSVNLYPNPVQRFLTVYSPEPVVAVRLFNFSGMQVFGMKPASGIHSLDIPVYQLPPGIYCLLTETAQQRSVQKVVISH